MSSSFFILSTLISALSPLIPLSIYWSRKRKFSASVIYVVILLITTFLCDIVGVLNSLVFNFQYVSESASYLYYFVAIISSNLLYRSFFSEKTKTVFNIFLGLLLMIYLYWAFTNRVVIKENDSKVPLGIAFVIFSLAYFYQLIKKMPNTYIQRIPMFWINSGFLLYSSGVLVLFIISNYLLYDLKKEMLAYWIFHNLANIICHGLIAIGFWKDRPLSRMQ